jgi:HTH-type transcriptional regulator / antitoxin HigA
MRAKGKAGPHGGDVSVDPPGMFIAEELEARGWFQQDLAQIMGRPLATVNEIVKGKKAITSETALDLAAAFGTSAELWLGLENDYRISLSSRERSDVERRSRLYSRIPVRELQKRGILSQTKNLGILEKQVCTLLCIDTLDEIPDLDSLGIAVRKSDGYTGSYTPAQIAWIFLARREAEALKARDFAESGFLQEAEELPDLSVNEKGWKQVQSRLLSWGIRLVFIEPFAGTKIDGALFWLNNQSPVIALSMRYDRVDHFWFTLMHELAHLFGRYGDKRGHIDLELVGPQAQGQANKPLEERKADRRASDWLIPPAAIKPYIDGRKASVSKSDIIELAQRLNRHPGILVGRMQYEGRVSYSYCRELLVKIRSVIMSRN